MTRPRCASPLPLGLLSDYWLGEISPEDEGPLEEHLLGCEECSRALHWMIELARATEAGAHAGLFRVAVSDAFIERLAAAGLRVRQYRVQPGGSVACTVTPEDDVMVARLAAPFDLPERTDVVVVDALGEELLRLADVGTASSGGEVILTEPIDALRRLGVATVRFRLVAIEERGERLLGEYTFNHTPHVAG